jgi:hypothetical protein
VRLLERAPEAERQKTERGERNHGAPSEPRCEANQEHAERRELDPCAQLGDHTVCNASFDIRDVAGQSGELFCLAACARNWRSMIVMSRTPQTAQGEERP